MMCRTCCSYTSTIITRTGMVTIAFQWSSLTLSKDQKTCIFNKIDFEQLRKSVLTYCKYASEMEYPDAVVGSSIANDLLKATFICGNEEAKREDPKRR